MNTKEAEAHLASVALHVRAVCEALPARRDPVRMALTSLIDNLGGEVSAVDVNENRNAQHFHNELLALVRHLEQRPADYIGLAIEAPEGASVTLVRKLVERIVLAVKEAADLVPHTRDDSWYAAIPIAVREPILKIVARDEELRAVHEDLGRAEEGRVLNAEHIGKLSDEVQALQNERDEWAAKAHASRQEAERWHAVLKARDAERGERKAQGAEVAEALRCLLEQVDATLVLVNAQKGDTLVDAVTRAISRAAALPFTPSEIEDLKLWVDSLRRNNTWPPKKGGV